MRRCVPATPAAVVGAERAAGVGANGGDQSTNTLVVAKLSVTTVDPDDEVAGLPRCLRLLLACLTPTPKLLQGPLW